MTRFVQYNVNGTITSVTNKYSFEYFSSLLFITVHNNHDNSKEISFTDSLELKDIVDGLALF